MGVFSVQLLAAQNLQNGRWLGSMVAGEVLIPFEFEWETGDQGPVFTLINDSEKLPAETVVQKGDSLFVRLSFFDSELHARIVDATHLEGQWHNLDKGPAYRLTFTASAGAQRIFSPQSSTKPAALADRWEVTFSPGTEGAYKAIGLFEQKGDRITGTFATETGDYRYLAGNLDGNRLRLSTFDGAHLFLFDATLGSGDSLKGVFYSGIHWQEPFVGKINPQAELRDPDSLTFLKPGYSKLDFSFPTPDSQFVSLSDSMFQGKVVVVQIMGTWCPNCLDESRFLTEMYHRYHDQGFEVVGLSYERTADFARSAALIQRLKDRLEVPYPLLYAGTSDRVKAAQSLPMLNHIMSYPTSMVIDRQGRIRRIHTGFYGPGTGDFYLRFSESFVALTEKLLAE